MYDVITDQEISHTAKLKTRRIVLTDLCEERTIKHVPRGSVQTRAILILKQSLHTIASLNN